MRYRGYNPCSFDFDLKKNLKKYASARTYSKKVVEGNQTIIFLGLSIHMLGNKIVSCELHKILSFWQKMINHFWQSVDVILEDVSVAERIVWC